MFLYSVWVLLYYASGVVVSRFQGFGGWFSLLVCVTLLPLPRFFVTLFNSVLLSDELG